MCAYLFQVVEVILVDPDASVEAAVLGHFYIHGAHVILAVVMTLLPQSAETSKGHASRLRGR